MCHCRGRNESAALRVDSRYSSVHRVGTRRSEIGVLWSIDQSDCLPHWPTLGDQPIKQQRRLHRPICSRDKTGAFAPPPIHPKKRQDSNLTRSQQAGKAPWPSERQEVQRLHADRAGLKKPPRVPFFASPFPSKKTQLRDRSPLLFHARYDML